ncbi:MAG: helix-turn-helix transcriptional regulator [Firmicutes bacterium]|nr:helix-turn-helix transcriptional regulator [Bacillota bacterium]
MDLQKIGSYISGKRKALGLTQRELAEKLGVSDKSVSKWERGICLPDVSLYLDLCSSLGISINEFIAGEDIGEEEIKKKTDDNIISVSKDGKDRRNVMKRVIAVLSALLIVTAAGLGWVLLKRSSPSDYISAYDRESAELRTIDLVSGHSMSGMFDWRCSRELKEIQIGITAYRRGEKIYDREVGRTFPGGFEKGGGGKIAVVPDFSEWKVKVMITGADGSISWDMDLSEILGGTEEYEYYGRSATSIDSAEKTDLIYGKKQAFYALFLGKDGLSAVPPDMLPSDEYALKRNDVSVLFTVRFSDKSKLELINESPAAKLILPDGTEKIVDGEIATLRSFSGLEIEPAYLEPSDNEDGWIYRMIFNPSGKVMGADEIVVSFYKDCLKIDYEYYLPKEGVSYNGVLSWAEEKFRYFMK